MSKTIIRNGNYQLTCTAEPDLINGEVALSLVLVSEARGYCDQVMNFHTTLPLVKGTSEDSINVSSGNSNVEISYRVCIVEKLSEPICVNVEVAMNITPIQKMRSKSGEVTLGELIVMINDDYSNYVPYLKSTLDLKIDFMIFKDLMQQLGIGPEPIIGRTFANQILSIYSSIDRELTYRRNRDLIRDQYEGLPIRRKRDMYKCEGHFIPDEPYGSDSMSSSWLSSDDYGNGLQKWENAGRIAIHAIKLG